MHTSTLTPGKLLDRHIWPISITQSPPGSVGQPHHKQHQSHESKGDIPLEQFFAKQWTSDSITVGPGQ